MYSTNYQTQINQNEISVKTYPMLKTHVVFSFQSWFRFRLQLNFNAKRLGDLKPGEFARVRLFGEQVPYDYRPHRELNPSQPWSAPISPRKAGKLDKAYFSSVSKPNFARKYALECSRWDLHNALLCTALKSLLFLKFAKNFENF